MLTVGAHDPGALIDDPVAAMPSIFRLSRAGIRGKRRIGFWRARDGSTAVEFGMVAMPFFFIIFAVLELGLVFVVDSVLENATLETARLIRTGQAKNSSMTAAGFKQDLCDRMSIFSGDCAARATVDVREIPNFTSPNPPDPMASGTFQTTELTYTNGVAGSIMLVRVWYKHPLITPFMNQGLSRLNDGTAMLVATSVFRNEPFN